MKINVANSGVMHICNKKAERCEMAYEVMVSRSQWYNFVQLLRQCGG